MFKIFFKKIIKTNQNEGEYIESIISHKRYPVCCQEEVETISDSVFRVKRITVYEHKIKIDLFFCVIFLVFKKKEKRYI